MTANEIEELLRQKYCSPSWAFLPQVRNQTGYNTTTRTADALAMQLYPSRGLHLHGFEIKVARGDWMTELKNPDKAEEIGRFCDYWWIVSCESVVKIEELPALWGLMVVKNDSLKVIKNAEINKDSQLITKSFLASILRKNMKEE